MHDRLDDPDEPAAQPAPQFAAPPGPGAAAAAFDCLPDAYLILNARHEVVLANRRYLKLVGAVREAILGRRVQDINQFGADAQREARREWLDATLEQLPRREAVWSPVFRYEMPVEHESGEWVTAPRYWRIKATLLDSSEPGLAGAVAILVSEVTEHVAEYERDQRERAKLRSQAQLRQLVAEEARAQLREHQERLEIAMAFSQVGAWELEPLTGGIQCTDQCRTNLGLGIDDLLTRERWFDEIVHPDDRARLHEAMTQALDIHEPFEVDFRIGWEHGPVRWILVRGVGRYQTNGALSSVHGFTLDITARKQAELETQASAAADKLAREQSDRLATAMDHFITTVSHELRSPLNAILSWCELMRRSPEPSLVTRAGEVINRNGRQLAHMVDDLLDSGAIVTGKLSVIPRPIDLGALAGIVVEDMRMIAEAKGLALVADRLMPAMVIADENRMKQIVWNLLSNAVKFSPQGSLIEVAITPLGERVELSVRDTGRGIDPSMLERVFERFQQSAADGEGRVAGLGLGLWLARNLMERQGGEIVAESAGLGHGSTFRLWLPEYR
ncbi:sensor histidine kinase [Burkholderia glumae]|uniref:histidine kinase n=1 Tax=Burkholderia glumae TaxID=337 RepID=A0AAP9XWR7_BURGL|nr:ATP-binding protein [Burkholderia glumae]ACR32193.1 PAS/PAC sensor signal transduction histidine kinase [Burkholderia glumae BGR1]AJY62719.1 sensory box protein [Burkholderia glumae LMG 2196 = ATCC 33617]KHJ59914.1 histidine kinase [Burkholderia glumae]MCM2484624.1 ATP-binding protein [Burkholderia glumae]MCM2495005.1 ATP-binding protein [Burkholderia glumae]